MFIVLLTVLFASFPYIYNIVIFFSIVSVSHTMFIECCTSYITTIMMMKIEQYHLFPHFTTHNIVIFFSIVSVSHTMFIECCTSYITTIMMMKIEQYHLFPHFTTPSNVYGINYRLPNVI